MIEVEKKSLIFSFLRAEERVNVLYILCLSLILLSNMYFTNFYFHLSLK